MSVYYSVKEHLRVSNNPYDDCTFTDAVSIMRGCLAALGALILVGDGHLFDLHLTADGKEYRISDDRVDADFKTVLDALNDAKELDLTVDYSYSWRGGWDMYELVGPFLLMEYMENADPEEKAGVFYSAWNNADCADGPGCLFASGENNGKIYGGVVPLTEEPEIPAGEWMNSDTVIYLETDYLDPEISGEVIEACKAFDDLGGDTELETESGLYFCLNNITLDSPEKAKRFLEAAKKLGDLMPEEFGLMANFFDTSAQDARIMVIEETDDWFCVKVARV